jgi:hypothetical protein
MKTILTAIATAIGAPSVFVYLSAKAQALPSVFAALGHASADLGKDPLLVAAILMTAILLAGKAMDFARERAERRVEAN